MTRLIVVLAVLSMLLTSAIESARAQDPAAQVWSTYLGGASYETVTDFTIDADDNFYVAGTTRSPDFQATAGAYDTTYNGGASGFPLPYGGDAFIAKFSPQGALLFATFLGGASDEEVDSIVFDEDGDIILFGQTFSSNFPVTAGAYDETHAGDADFFIAKLSADGSSLIFSTFIGGSAKEEMWSHTDMALDEAGNIFVCGESTSGDFPTTGGAYDTTYNGGRDVVLCKLSTDGSALLYSTYLGGALRDHPAALRYVSPNKILLVGRTRSSTFPTTLGAYDTTYDGLNDGFVTMMNISNSTLVFSTFLSGNTGVNDEIECVALDANQNIWVALASRSPGFPTTPGVVDSSYNGLYDLVIAKLSSDGSSLEHSTFVGGAADEKVLAINLASDDSPWCEGLVGSSDYPVTRGALDVEYGGAGDIFLVHATPSLNALRYSTFIGGSGYDDGGFFKVLSNGDLAIAGFTMSADFSVTSGAYDTTFGGSNTVSDGFVMRLDPSSAQRDDDNDLLPNWWENLYDLNLVGNDGAQDYDADDLTCLQEFSYDTNPVLADTDVDGVSDSQELFTLETDPKRPDSDNDGLTDGAEVGQYQTDPNDNDTDDDSYRDGDEVSNGSDPLDPSSTPIIPPIGKHGGSKGGVAIANGYLYACEGQGLYVYDLANPGVPVRMGHVTLADVAYDVAASGSFVFVASNNAGLVAVDVSSPSNPQVADTLQLASHKRVSDIAVAGSYAYLTGDQYELAVVDVRNPYDLRLASLLKQNYDGESTDVIAVQGHYAYVDGITFGVVDITNPEAPLRVGSTPLIGAYDIQVRDNFAYVARVGYPNDSMVVVDVSTPSSPTIHQTLHVSEPVGGITLEQARAYLGCLDHIRTIDISQPSSPAEIASYPVPATIFRMAIQTPYLYAGDANGQSYVATLDENGAITQMTTSFADIGHVRDVYVAGKYAYLLCQFPLSFAALDSRLWIADISNPVSPVVKGHLDLLNAVNVTVQGDFAYIAEMDTGMVIADVSDPNAPSIAIRTDFTPNVNSVVSDGAYAYVATSGAIGFFIYDISNPAAPALVGQNDPLQGSGVTAQDVVVSGGYAFLAGAGNGLVIFDISDPETPVRVATVDTAGTASHIFKSGDYVYLASLDGDLDIIHVANPVAPGIAAHVSIPGDAYDVFVINDFAYVPDGKSVRIVDVSNPASPQQNAFIDTSADDFLGSLPGAQSIFVSEWAYVATGAGGLTILPIPPAPPETDVLPRYIDTDYVVVSGNAVSGGFVVVGGGEFPAYQQLALGETAYAIPVQLKQEAVNTLSVRTINQYGLASLSAKYRVVESVAFPDTVEGVTSLAIEPDPAAPLALLDFQQFSCTATFSNSATADITEFATWIVSNGETITAGGLYVNTVDGPALVQASDLAVLSNLVTVEDAGKALDKLNYGVIAGKVTDHFTGLGLGPPSSTAKVRTFLPFIHQVVAQHNTQDTFGNYAYLINEGKYDIHASSPAFRPEIVRLLHVAAGAAAEQDFALRPVDTEPPIMAFIEPMDGSVSGKSDVGITAIVYDQLSVLGEAQLIVNGQPYELRLDEPQPAISEEGFFRDVWPLPIGSNTLQLRAVDSEGNEAVSETITVDIDTTPLQLLSAEAIGPTQLIVEFNKKVLDPNVLLTNRYSISSGAKTELTIISVERLSETRFLLTTDGQLPNTQYTVSVHGVNDTAGHSVRVLGTASATGYDTTIDTDGDGVTNDDETTLGTNADSADSDSDGMPDGWEEDEGLDPTTNDAGIDPDSDGRTNLQEYGDHTDPHDADSDDDGLEDGAETAVGSHPLLPDTDGDGASDGYEVAHGLNPLAADLDGDPDYDWLDNRLEVILGTNPNVADSDADGLLDGEEYARYNTSPNDADTDDDSLSDGAEVDAGTNPLRDSRIRAAVVAPDDGRHLRGNSVTVKAELTTGSIAEAASVALEYRAGGSSDPFGPLPVMGGENNPRTDSPFEWHWDADAFAPGSYELRAVATSIAAFTDPTPEITTVVIDPGALYVENDDGGDRELVADVDSGTEERVGVTSTDGLVGAEVLIPADALSSDALLTISLPNANQFSPLLAANETLTGIYIEVGLTVGKMNLEPGQTVTLTVRYPDVDADGLVDDTSIDERLLKLKYLNPGNNRFEPLLSSIVFPASDVVVSVTDHLSVFALVAEGPVQPIEIITSSLPQALEGTPYASIIEAEGGLAPYAWSTSLGAWPSGLTLSPTGNLSGTPAQSGIFTPGVQVADAQAPTDTDTKGFSLHVASISGDEDEDGISNGDEGTGDPDNDGLANYLDTDSDNDGYSDSEENLLGSDPLDPLDTPVLGLPLGTAPLGALLIVLGVWACLVRGSKRKA